MAVTFVRWNPILNPLSGGDLEQAAKVTAFDPNQRGKRPQYLSDWSVRVSGKTKPGDTIYMFSWTDNGLGSLMGRGKVAGPEYKDVNWRGSDYKKAVYIPIRWKLMVPLDNAITGIDVLSALPGARWPNRESGEILPKSAALALDKLWQSAVANWKNSATLPMEPELDRRVQLAASKALIGRVGSKLQGVALTTYSRSVRLRFIYIRELSKAEYRNVKRIITQFENTAISFYGLAGTHELSVVKPNKKPKLRPGEQWVFLRK